MIRSLLVALDSSAYAHAAVVQAIELGKACQARLVGLHVLDIRYLEMPPYLDYSYTFEAVPPGRLLVGESGIARYEEVERLAAYGIDAVLVGETLLRAPDLGQAVRDLMEPVPLVAARPPAD